MQLLNHWIPESGCSQWGVTENFKHLCNNQTHFWKYHLGNKRLDRDEWSGKKVEVMIKSLETGRLIKRNTSVKENLWNSKIISLGMKLRGWILELLHRQSIGFIYWLNDEVPGSGLVKWWLIRHRGGRGFEIRIMGSASDMWNLGTGHSGGFITLALLKMLRLGA